MLWGAIALALGAGGAAWAAVGLVRHLLLRRGILDHPNERSNHTAAKPRGGGIGMLIILLPLWTVIALFGRADATLDWIVGLAALGLGAISWVDDLRRVGPLPRLAAQIAAVAIGLAVLPGAVFQDLLPLPLDRVLSGFLWLWFINLFNFMDGIDGISGVEAAALGGGLFVVGLIGAGLATPLQWQALTLAATALGFLAWNWQPARIFLGDVGSVPLGYLLGWLLLNAAVAGLWAAALILPLYYLADSGLTLLRRLLKGENIGKAHSQHFYQLAVRRGRSHAQVALSVAGVNVLLVTLAVITVAMGASPAVVVAAIASAGAFVIGLLFWMAGRPDRAR